MASTPDAAPVLGELTVTRDGKFILIGLAVAAVAASWVAVKHGKTPYDAEFEDVAGRRRVDADLLRAFAMVESSMNPNAIGPTGDYGLMQVNERTAKGYGVDARTLVGAPAASIDLAARILLDMRRYLGDRYSLPALISSYNQGAAATLKHGIRNLTYVARVQFHHQMFALGRAFRDHAAGA